MDGGGEPHTLSGDDVLARVNAIAEAGDVQSVWSLLVEALWHLGFERVNYGYTRFRTGKSIGDPEDVFFLSTHALDEVRAFHESGLYLRSADYRWVRENVGACPWDWVRRERAAGRLSAEECAAMDELGSGRGRAGYTISFPQGAPRSKGAMGLAAPRGVSQAECDAAWAANGRKTMALAHMAHARMALLPLPVARADLRPRQREILEWIADGKTLQDVCVLTGLSLSAVEKTLRRAREALMVETTAQAVAKAAFLNQIFVRGDFPQV
ncbi:MAG: helix-turn-helix transcriptional regulator [Pseudooceanicola sp.]